MSRNAQPKIIIFADGQALIESAGRVKQLARHHDGRGADQAKLKAATKDVPRRFLMLDLRVHTKPSADPDLIGLADLNFRMLLHEFGLDSKFLRKPKIIGIEKREVAPARGARSPVSRCRYAFAGLPDQSQLAIKRGKCFLCVIG